MVQHLKQKLSILNASPKSLDGPRLLHELVSQTSSASAIDFLEHGIKRRKFSYQQLHILSDLLAQRIVELTARLEDASAVIPIFLPQCPELYIVMLAVLKAGKAFCPLNLDTPDERLKFILSDVSAHLLITNTAHLDRLRSVHEVRKICADRELLKDKKTNILSVPHINGTNLAYVLYTSGSTGLPKAVSVSHSAVTQSLLAHDRHIPDFSRFLQFAAPTFDVSIFEIFFPWFRGRTLVGCLRERMLEDLPGTIRTLAADAAELTPTVVGNLLQGRSSVPGLKLLLTIGEMLTQHVVREYGHSPSQDGILWAMYGPTEAAIHCTLQAQINASSRTGNIGSPLATVSTFVLAPYKGDSEQTDATVLPWGEEGELALGGHQLAEEYLNRPEMTSAAFINHPKYGRLYRTGDRAKFCNDGTIECLGRVVSGQVKLRGQRVELAEIEEVIMKVDGCRVAVTTIINETLVAFCAIGSHKISRSEVLRVCKQWLPGFMLPSDVLLVPSMPQLPSGKINTRSLEAMYTEFLQRNSEHRSPEFQSDNPVALTILCLVQKSLGRKLDLDSDLAAAGLDSLRAIHIASRLRKIGYDVGAVDVLAAQNFDDLIKSCTASPTLFEHPKAMERLTIHDLKFSDPEVAFEASDISLVTPCTPLQEAMLVETMSRPSAYCNWIELELTVSRTYEEISFAISQLARQNTILRSGFYPSSKGAETFYQIVWKDLEPSQIQKVPSLPRKDYTLDNTTALLRPFKVSILDKPDRQRILLQIHHALYDGWSFDLLLVDLDSLLRGEAPTVRPQFHDVSEYYIEQRKTTATDADKTYWASLLRDYVPTTLVNYNGEMKIDGGLQSYRSRSSIDPRRLSERAQSLVVNPQVLFQTAVGYILSLYTGSSDVTFGNVTSGRTLPITGLEDVVGPCIASLPCRMDFNTFPGAHQALNELQRLNRESLHHCALPLRDIARAAAVPPGTRLFDVLFVWQQSLPSASASSLAAKVVDSADELEFNLTLEFEPCDSFISFRATFNPSNIPKEQVALFSQQVDQVVAMFLDDAHCTIADLGRSFDPSTLSIANSEYRHDRDHVSLSNAVETWAAASPEKEAVVFGQVTGGVIKVKNTISYSELNTRANQLAHLLSEQGVSQDQLVCIMMEKSVDLYVAILAALKLGAGYLPLVHDTPAERVQTILTDANVTFCISDSSSIHSLRTRSSSTILDLPSTDLSPYSGENLNTPYNGSHVAYAVFTSGSTGTPKGVLVTQQNLMSNIKFLSSLYPASSEARMLQSCSQAFDVSVFEIFYTWHVGMSLCTATKDDLFRDFEASINALGITHLSLTPTVAALVDPSSVPKVEFLVTAGEALTENVRRQWSGRGLYQGYGPSETTNICTIRPSVTMSDLINNIGQPFDNTSAFVLDPNSNMILPRGAVGELCFGGEQVFRGYLNRPDLNAAKLINLVPYGRIYRSGDMGRLLPDNCILSAGRFDDQVKIRGQRVELGEITSIVLDDHDVADCATLFLVTRNGTQCLVTFWVHRDHKADVFATVEKDDTGFTISRIFDSISRQLPTYMLPSYLVAISKMPMTAQAKIDKRLLRATFNNLEDRALTHFSPANTNGGTNGDFSGAAAPLSDWERNIANVFARTLEIDVDRIRPTSSFFNLGLDSVSAIRFCHRLRQAEIADFTVAELMKNPTIAALRTLLKSPFRVDSFLSGNTNNIFNGEECSSIRSAIENAGLETEKIRPCTPLQEAMLASSSSSDAAYNNTLIFDVKGDITRIQQSWEVARNRHEILRTSFVPLNHSSFAFAQVVTRPSALRWGHLDTLQNVQYRMDAVVQDLLISRKPPVYLATHASSSATRLIFSCHHALYDGIAITKLLEEIQHIYLQQELPPVISYDRYLQHMISQNCERLNAFWSSCFTNFEPTYFPDLTGQIHKNPGVAQSTKRDLVISLSTLREASRQASVSVLSIVQAAWVKLLHYYTQEQDLCFGNVVSGRAFSEDGLYRLVAPCFNTLPIRAQFDFSKPNSALIQHLHNFNVESFAHQLTALRRIQNNALNDGSRLFDTLVILQQPSEPLDDTIWVLEEDLGKMDLPLVCEIYQHEFTDSVTLTLHYNTNLLSNEDADVVARTFESCLGDLVYHADAAALDFIGLPQDLKALSNTNFERLPSQSDLLHGAFIQNASTLHADTIALDFFHSDGRKTTWSYKALNLVADHVAHRLRCHGVGVEDIVPIHIEKSPMFYASMLGVLKAGAAFAPVHPDLPEARKDLMFKDLNPVAILCTKNTPILKEGSSATVINVADLEHSKLDACDTSQIDSLTGSNLAYCLYTSGSTGVPKAVSMEHKAPVQTIESSRPLVPWTSASRLLQYAAVTFDMCYYDCFMAWTFGFTLCAAEQHAMFDNLVHIVDALDVTLLDLTPSVAASVLRKDVPKVQWLYCIGEAMSSDVARQWAGACVNSYGPTEAAFCTTMFRMSDDVKTSVIGRPYPSTSFAVFSPHGQQPLPLLSAGELYIGGAQLARDYHGRPELTDDRFVDRCGQRFYKSGDMVRMLSDGNFEFIGRADDQVKIRGLRVELGEINQVLQSCDARVRSVVTQILKKDAKSKEQLVSFLATGSKLEQIEESDLRERIMQAAKSRLPGYMVPQIHIFVDRIPRSMAGKVDKKALAGLLERATSTQGLWNGANKSHIWTEAESHVRHVLSRLSSTPLEEVLPEVSIYQLGLDSISAVQIASALRGYGYTVNASEVMKAPTCVELAARLGKQPQESGPVVSSFDFEAFDKAHRPSILLACGLKDQHVEAIRPCTPLQQSMISQFIAKDGSVYYNHIRLKLHKAKKDITKLKGAWEKTMMLHPILRSGFAQIKDESSSFAMVRHATKSAILPWSEISDTDSQLAAEKLSRLQQEALARLHQPMWHLRLAANAEDVFLDIWMFHALFDAQSMQLILADVVAFYDDHPKTRTTPFDSSLGELLQLTNEQSERTEQFWRDLGKRTVPSRFPNFTSLRHRPAAPVILKQRSSMSVLEIENGCRAGNITLQAAGIASWSTLLSAYAGEPTVTMGVVLSGRTSDAANDAVFPCINTVPFPCTVTDDKTSFVKSVMDLNAELHQNQFTPLNKVQKLMGMSSEPLFDSLFAFQKTTGYGHDDDIWTIVQESATTEYPISIELELSRSGLQYCLTYLPHVVPAQQASLILQQLDHVMRGYIVMSNEPTTESLLDQSLYSITPAKEVNLPSDVKLLHQFVESTADAHPDQIAFEFASAIHNGQLGRKKWSYLDLDTEGNKIAHLLLNHNVQQGGLVGVCFDKCPEASFAMLGILKAGCAFVAIDPSAPSARQAFIIEDSGAQVVLTMSVRSATFKEQVKVPVLDLDKSDMDDCPASRPQLKSIINPQDRSYCLYTSGTTGTPKGCELTHENAVQALLAFQRLFAGHWDAHSRWLQFASFHFDVSVLEQYWSWSVGICVVSAPRDLIFEDLAGSIRTLNITHIDLTPSLAQTLHPDDVPSLCKGVFITGGESLKQEILDVWGPKSVIYNGYGPTEATIGCTMYPRVPANGKPSNIGPQFDNVGSYVLKPTSDMPVLRGAVGELCISGKLVGKGYLNRPELTKERFAHLARFDARVYRSGDLVRILHDGTFDFLGRVDDQIKLRGQRLEIGEINSVIRQSSKTITDVATLVLKHPKHQKEQLVAFVVVGIKSPREPKVLPVEAPKLSGAKEACHDRLPPYMVPTYFVPLASMPLNINNKADGKQLKQIYEALSSSDLLQLSAISSEVNETWSKTEERLRHVLSEALGIGEEALEKNSSFYEVGMDSISVIGVSQAIKQAGFSGATAAALMRHATISRLAKALSRPGSDLPNCNSLVAAQQAIRAVAHRYRREVAQTLGVGPQDLEALAPTTPLQQGMIARYLDSENGLYFNTFKFDIRKEVDIPRLRSAWKVVLESTQILRTAFVNTDNGHVQAVLRTALLPWFQNDVEHKPLRDSLRDSRQGWLARNTADVSRPFELHFADQADRRLLFVHMFHALYDGNSIELIFEKVWQTYNGREADASKAPTFHEALPHGPLSIVEGARRFWEVHLREVTPALLPILPEKPASDTIVVTRDLRSLAAFEITRRKLNVTTQAIAQACWAHVLQKYVRASVTIGMVVSGRNLELEHADGIVGPMFNTIPYNHRVEAGDSWARAILRAHEFNTEALSYQHTPLRDILKWCKRNPTQPLFDTLFAYQSTHTTQNHWRRNTMWEVLDDDAVADYPLAFEIEQTSSDQFKLNLVSQSHISDLKTSNQLLDSFEEALKNVIVDPSVTLEPLIDMRTSAPNGIAADFSHINGVNGTTGFHWSEDAIAIRTEIATLAGVEITDIDHSTSIFELGLDSIDAIKLSSRFKKRGLNLTVSSIMRALTIKSMVLSIQGALSKGNRYNVETEFASRKDRLRRYVESCEVDMSVIDDVMPPTPLQEAMVAEMLASDYTRYYNFDVAELEADTDVDRLFNAWHSVIDSTPILRTAFLEVDDPKIDGAFAQVVMKQESLKSPVERQRIDTAKATDFPMILDGLRSAAAQSQPLKPPFKVILLETTHHKYQILSIAHALYDGWSLGLLHASLSAAYHGDFHSSPSAEATLADILAGTGPEAGKFWKDYLGGMKPSILPRHVMGTTAGAKTHRKEIRSNMILGETMRFAKTSKVSLQTLGQTVFAITLASYVGSLDVTFGCVLSGRDDEERSQLVFPTMNTVAIRTILHGSRLNLLQHVQNNFSNVKQWQHYPLRKASALARVPGKMFDSLFIYQKSLDQSADKERKLYHSIESQSDVEYPLCVEMEVVHNTLMWRCAVKEDIMDSKGAQMLLSRLDQVLHSLIHYPDRATMDSNERGISICDLPPFQVASTQTLFGGREIELSNPATDKPLSSQTSLYIRKALASVAQVTEDAVEPGMSIFHLGLDSISAIKVSSLLRKQGIILSVGQMLKAGTVEKMTEVAEQRTLITNDVDDANGAIVELTLREIEQTHLLSRVGIDSSQVERILPLAAGQLYMVSMWLNTSGTKFYPEFVYNLEGSVDLAELRESWQQVVDSNSILRTCIVKSTLSGPAYIQVVLSKASASLTDITDFDNSALASTVQRNTNQQPWIHLSASRTVSGWSLKLNIHHALYDGVSLPLLMRQLQDLCNGATMSPPDARFDKYIAMTHSSSVASQRKAFWKQYLVDLEPQHSMNAESTPTLNTEIYQPSLLQTSSLEHTARRRGVSAQSIFLAVYANLHATRSGQHQTQDVVLGIYLANRSLAIDQLSTAAVPTVNLVPLRIRAPLNSPLIDTANQIQQDLQTLSEPANATTSLFEISEWTGVKVDTFINFLNLPDTEEGENTPSQCGVKITHKAGWQEAVSKITETTHDDWEAPNELVDEHVNAAYLHAIDIEATICAGKLDVGIFAPTGMLSLEDGEGLIADLKTRLEGVFQA